MKEYFIQICIQFNLFKCERLRIQQKSKVTFSLFFEHMNTFT